MNEDERNISSEILIPVKGKEFNLKDSESYLSLFTTLNYTNFRKILIQGELVRFFVVLKVENGDEINNKKLLENIFLKVEFNDMSNNDLENKGELNTEEYNKRLNDLFCINLYKNYNKNSNNEYDVFKRLEYNNNTMVFECIKQVIVPKEFINELLLMKLHIMVKNAYTYMEEINALDYFKSGIFDSFSRFKVLKTFFKEVKVIRPLNILNIKQIDLLLDTSLLQAKIGNDTLKENIIDDSLKYSKYLKKDSNKKNYVKNGLNLQINELQVLKEETTIDENDTLNIKRIKEIYMKNDELNIKGILFNSYNNELPVSIKPGEDYNLTLKVIRSVFISDKYDKAIDEKNNKISHFNYESPIRQSDEQSETSSTFAEAQILKSNRTLTLPSNMKNYDTVSNKLSSNNVSIHLMKNKYNNIVTQSSHKIIIDTDKDDDNEFDSLDNFKVTLITPIILNISSEIFYEDLFMCLNLKWVNEINRYLKIDINIPENIYLHQYFSVGLKCRNISSHDMNIFIEISDSFEDFKLNDTNQHHKYESIPYVTSETKFQNFGLFNCNEDKVFNLKFLALKKGFCNIPTFSLTDSITGKRYFIVYQNKIFIKDDKENKNNN